VHETGDGSQYGGDWNRCAPVRVSGSVNDQAELEALKAAPSQLLAEGQQASNLSLDAAWG
jgi:hypothetical protein